MPGARTEEWLDAGECRDCFLATWHHSPLGSVQYILALGQDRDGQDPLRFRFGMIGSTDNHNAMPGEGYKEVARWNSILLLRLTNPDARRMFLPPPAERTAQSRPVTPDLYSSSWATWDVERTNSMAITGGLVAVHAANRSRSAIWDALKSRNVYATSGERMLLWVNLVNAPGGAMPMGSAVRMNRNPQFEVKAVGAFIQNPGCPGFQRRLLGARKLETLCHNECFNPSNRKRRITRIEVVRIHPQHNPSEPVGPLIEDPWKTLECLEAIEERAWSSPIFVDIQRQ